MLKRQPVTADGRAVNRLEESVRVFKPFKPPAIKQTRDQPQRKKRRVSYKENKQDDSDSDDNAKKKRKKFDKDSSFGEIDPLTHDLKRYPKYEPKSFESLSVRRFSIPAMRNSEGEVIATVLSGVSLGIRPQTVLLPRPLHDPMEDHAIVLYDPTIDDRETEEEKREREKEEERERVAKEAEEKTKGMLNPHKPLRKLLGEDQKKKLTVQKVAVVLYPKLTKVLRPHQIEGVKACHNHSRVRAPTDFDNSSYTSARQE